MIQASNLFVNVHINYTYDSVIVWFDWTVIYVSLGHVSHVLLYHISLTDHTTFHQSDSLRSLIRNTPKIKQMNFLWNLFIFLIIRIIL